MRRYDTPDDPDEDKPDYRAEEATAQATLRRALSRYSHAHNSAELQLAVLAMHEGLRQVLRVWLLHQDYLTERQKENIQDPLTRFGELLDVATAHTDLFVNRRAAWRDEIEVLNDHRNMIAHPIDEMAADTALAAAAGWADLVRRLWPFLVGGEPPELRHPDPGRVTAPHRPPSSSPIRPTLSFYAEPAFALPPPPRRRPPWRLLFVMTVFVLFTLTALFFLSQLLAVLPRL